MTHADRAVETFLVERLRSDHSRRGYRDDWRKFVAWLAARGQAVTDISAPDVRDYVDHLAAEGKSRAVRARALSVIRSMYGAIVVAGVMVNNPAREVKNPR